MICLGLGAPLTKFGNQRSTSERARYNPLTERQEGLLVSFVLEKHQQDVISAVETYQAAIAEIEGHIRLRAMANEVSDRELDLLRRLKDEKSQMLYRYENLREAFKAILPDRSVAAE